ncbi:MAG: hypothetical protein ABR961_04770 [Thermoanaerobaculaceae bacterium]
MRHSSLIPGIVATRTPAAEAARRAAVWVIDFNVTARTAFTAAIAAGIGAGGP